MQKLLRLNLESLGPEITKTKMQPIILDLISDKDIEVKIEAMSLLPLWSTFVGNYVIDLINNSSIVLSYDSPNWRIRHSIFKNVIEMNMAFKSKVIFDKNFRGVILSALRDKAFQIRKLIVKSIPSFATILEDNYLVDNFLKEAVKNVLSTEFYSYKISSVYAIEQIVLNLKQKDKCKDIYAKTMAKLLEDQCLNLRMVALKVILRVH